jgi:hypothetical protein
MSGFARPSPLHAAVADRVLCGRELRVVVAAFERSVADRTASIEAICSGRASARDESA